jgi:hypothetical protein
VSRLNGPIERGLVHVAHHQDAIGFGVLHHGGNQAALLIEIELQRHQKVLVKTKNPPSLAGCKCDSERKFTRVRTRRSCHRMMVMMVVDVTQHEVSV